MVNSPFVDERSAPHVDQVRKRLASSHRFSKDIVDRSAASFGPPWVEDFEETLRLLFPTQESLESAVKGYAAFAFDALRRQKRFEQELAYPPKTHEDAAQEIYLNPTYMNFQYLPGLLLSHFLWPHHYRQLQFFDTAFLEPLRWNGALDFAEIGIGTGLYSRRLLQRHPRMRGTGYDLSPSSVAFTEGHLRAFGCSGRYFTELRDVTADPIPPVACLICVEVLEHLEDPLAFLCMLRSGLTPGGRAFITAALDAPNADHIYLYRKPEEVLEQLAAAGFVLEQSFLGAAHKPTGPGLPVPLAAAFVVT